MNLQIVDSDVRIGDRVLIPNNANASSWWRLHKETGLCGTVCGHYIIRAFYGRNSCPPGLTPGGYWHLGAPVIQLDRVDEDSGSKVRIISSADLELLDVLPATLELRRKDLNYLYRFTLKHRFADLPSLPFFEGDKVKLKNRSLLSELSSDVIVSRIEYERYLKTPKNQKQDIEIYSVKSLEFPLREITVSESDIRLLERGNYYWYENDISKLSFKTIDDELKFYLSVNQLEQLTDPNTNVFVWSRQRALQEIKEGRADVLLPAMTPFGTVFGNSKVSVFLYRFIKKSDISEKIREAALKGAFENIYNE